MASETEARERIALVLARDGIGVASGFAEIEALLYCSRGHDVAVVAQQDGKPGLQLFEVIRAVGDRGVTDHIVLVAADRRRQTVRRALNAGVDGVVQRDRLEDALAVTVRAVASGQLAVPARERRMLASPALSHRENQVLSLVAQGLTNAEIATQLVVTEATVKSHLSSVFEKLGVASRSEAAGLVLDRNDPIGGGARRLIEALSFTDGEMDEASVVALRGQADGSGADEARRIA